jgi:hypothetical protein
MTPLKASAQTDQSRKWTQIVPTSTPLDTAITVAWPRWRTDGSLVAAYASWRHGILTDIYRYGRCRRALAYVCISRGLLMSVHLCYWLANRWSAFTECYCVPWCLSCSVLCLVSSVRCPEHNSRACVLLHTQYSWRYTCRHRRPQ